MKKSIVLVLLLCLTSTSLVSAVAPQPRPTPPRPKYVKLPQVAGAKEVRFYIDASDLKLDMNKGSTVNLRFDPTDVYVSTSPSANFRVNVFGINDNNEREFDGTENITLTKADVTVQSLALKLGQVNKEHKKFQVDVYDTKNELIATHDLEVDAIHVPKDETDHSHDSQVADCDNSVFGKCQIDYILKEIFQDRVSFVTKPSKKAESSVVKTAKGNWRVEIPMLAASDETKLSAGSRSPKFLQTNASPVNAAGGTPVVMGKNSVFTGAESVALGSNTKASGNSSFAMGDGSEASGANSFAAGIRSKASGAYSFAAGVESRAQGEGSMALGRGNIAADAGSIAIGNQSTAAGIGSITIGNGIYNVKPGSILMGVYGKALFIGKFSSDGVNYQNRVGINTDNPQYELDVDGIVNAKEFRINGQPFPTGSGGLAGPTGPAGPAGPAGASSIDGLSDAKTTSDSIYLGAKPGTSNIGSNNTVVGKEALRFNTSGSKNTAIGSASLNNNATGKFNTAIGSDSLYRNTVGWSNTAMGFNSLGSNVSGSNNTATGSNSLYRNTGSDNTASGFNSLYFNTSGSYNTASGTSSLESNITGYGNTASGYGSLYYNTTGHYNTAIGASSLYSKTTGDGNIAIGYQAGSNITSGSANIIIGTSIGAPLADGSNQLNIGNAIYGSNISSSNRMIGIGKASPQATLDVNGDMIIRGGLPGLGKVLTSDASGKATWQTPTGSGGGNTPDLSRYVRVDDTAKAIGRGALALSSGSVANGNDAIAFGRTAKAEKDDSFAVGKAAFALNFDAIALGARSTANGAGSVAIGYDSNAFSRQSFAIGGYTRSKGTFATALGVYSSANGENAMALGVGAKANSDRAMSFGRNVNASAMDSMVIGSGAGTSAGPGNTNANSLINNISNTLMVGFNSNISTLFVGSSAGVGTTGNIGIGNSNPTAKLDVAGVVKATGFMIGDKDILSLIGSAGSAGPTGPAGPAGLAGPAGPAGPAGSGSEVHDYSNEVLQAQGFNAFSSDPAITIRDIDATSDASMTGRIEFIRGAGGGIGVPERSTTLGFMGYLRDNNTDFTIANAVGKTLFYNQTRQSYDRLEAPALSLALMEDGKVGVGTQNPTTKLDVAGVVKATGFMIGDLDILSLIGSGAGSAPDLSSYIKIPDGATASGDGSISLGRGSKATAADSTALGYQNIASGENSLVAGANSEARGFNSFVMGYESLANGNFATAIGYQNKAGDGNPIIAYDTSVAMGRWAEARNYSFAFGSAGNGAKANGHSFAFGSNLKADERSFAFGNSIEVNEGSFAFGDSTKASIASYAFGFFSKADNHSYAFGDKVMAAGKGQNGDSIAIAMGGQSSATNSHAMAFGYGVQASAKGSTVIGVGMLDYTKAVYQEGFVSPLVNNIENSLMVGFNSNQPSLFVGPSAGLGTTGKVGIGNSDPQAKLDVSGDIKAISILTNSITGASPTQPLTITANTSVIGDFSAISIKSPAIVTNGLTASPSVADGYLSVNSPLRTGRLRVVSNESGPFTVDYINSATSGFVYMALRRLGLDKWYISSSPNLDNLIIANPTTTAVVISKAGKVGIGITPPAATTAALQVSGKTLTDVLSLVPRTTKPATAVAGDLYAYKPFTTTIALCMCVTPTTATAAATWVKIGGNATSCAP